MLEHARMLRLSTARHETRPLAPAFDRAITARERQAGRSVFDLSVSGRPEGSEAAGGREKIKTENKGAPGGAQALSAGRPSPKGAQGRGPGGGRWAGRMVDGPGRSGQSRWGMGVIVPLLGWPERLERLENRCFRPILGL